MENGTVSAPAPEPVASKVRRVLLSPVARGGPVREFFLGIRYFFKGLRTVFTYRRDLWIWAVIPVVLSAALYAGTFLAIAFKLDDIIRHFLPAVDENAWWKALMVVIWILVMAAVVLAGYFLFVPVIHLVSFPFNEKLSEKVEQCLLGTEPPAFVFRVFLKELSRALAQETVKLLLYVLLVGPFFVLSLVLPGAGPVILFLVGGFLTSLYLAYDQLDRCFSRHGMRVHQRVNFTRKFLFRILGLGTVAFFLLLIPGGILVALPSAVAGAAVLFLESDEAKLRALIEARMSTVDDQEGS